jgi:hypothetical protein
MIYYAGHQWRVTGDGIELIDGNYFIRMEDIDMPMGEGGWIGHMAEKNWVDIGDFKRALEVAKKVGK